jgi:hypothetical protein
VKKGSSNEEEKTASHVKSVKETIQTKAAIQTKLSREKAANRKGGRGFKRKAKTPTGQEPPVKVRKPVPIIAQKEKPPRSKYSVTLEQMTSSSPVFSKTRVSVGKYLKKTCSCKQSD